MISLKIREKETEKTVRRAIKIYIFTGADRPGDNKRNERS